MKQQFRRCSWLLFVVILIVGVGACEFFDRQNRNAPTTPAIDSVSLTEGIYSHEDTRFPYEASETPGVTVHADLSVYHIAGQPYGEWVLNATWRNEDRNTIVEVNVVDIEIDETTGQATALIPSSFLNQVFQEAHDRYMATKDEQYPDTSVWFHRPGLYLNFHPANQETWAYFTF